MQRDLPVMEIIPGLKKALGDERVVILQAPPGAGKSTLLPLELLNESWLKGKKMLMLEPRRLAARSVAARMAYLLGEEPGETVGYRVRFESRVSNKTRIEVVTEGILTRMMQQDSSLDGIGLLIFDEFHERSLHADLALAFALQVQQVLRDDLRILLMSATLDGARLSSLLGNAPVITSAGKQYPVDLRYLDEDEGALLPVRMSRAIRKALSEQEGDVLAFFPGAGEIHRTAELLEEEGVQAIVQPLYGDLPFQKQQEAILPDPQGLRKVVLATSIAETSLTIEGIHTVVDSGYSRVPRFDPRTGLTRLETVRVTKDAADQRAGRAGRLGPGVCYRLWSKGAHNHLVAQRAPEILEADLASLVLEAAQWGIKDLSELKWITVPPAAAVAQARELLVQLEAISEGRITPRGKEMLAMPTHPRIAHMLLEAQEMDKANGSSSHLGLAADVAALMEERDPLSKEAGTDMTLRLDVLKKWRNKERVNADRKVLERIERLSLQWRKMMKAQPVTGTFPETDAGLLIAAAYPERIARKISKEGDRYRLANGRLARLNTHDPLNGYEWLAVAQLDAGSNEGKIFMAAPLDPEEVMHLAHEKEVLEWDDKNEGIRAAMERRIGNITLQSVPLKEISDEARAELWCRVIRKHGLGWLNLQEEVERWRIRMQCVKKWRPDEEWPDVSEEALLATLEEWLIPLIGKAQSRKELEKLDAETIKNTLAPYELLQRLDKLLPDRLPVPSGSLIPLLYYADGSIPEMHVRMQEIFGTKESPTVNEGRMKIKLFLLSPARRPVQVTQDLSSFWKNTYPEVRRELKIKYPRHYWPEDPLTAEAVRGVIRKKK